MKRLVALIAVVLALNTSAFAQPSAQGLTGLGMSPELANYFVSNGVALSVLTNNAALKSANATPAGANISILKVNASNNTELGALTGQVIGVGPVFTPLFNVDSAKVAFVGAGVIAAPTSVAVSAGAANTPNSTFDSSGLTFASAGMGENLPAGQVFTPATNLTPVAGARLLANRLGSVATAAPTLAVVFAQPTASVGKVVRIYNQGANPLVILPEDGSINATAALTPFSCAAGKVCTGYGLSTSQMIFGAQ